MKRRMTLKALVAVGFTGLLGPVAFARDAQSEPPCCRKKPRAADAAKDKPTAKMRCSLTGKVVDKCCCEQREGKTYCTLAGKTVESCCCEPAPEQPGKK